MSEMRFHTIRKWLEAKHVGQAFQPAIQWPGIRPFTKADLPAVQYYKRRLPHWELGGSTYFLTFRVNKRQENPFANHELASIFEEILWFGFGKRYTLEAYVIMPDHVHLLLSPIDEWSLGRILQGLKGFSARQINSRLGRKGKFWQDETFDHLVRNDSDWFDKFSYIHNNPVTAGLVNNPQDYPFSSMVTIHSKGRLESLPQCACGRAHTERCKSSPGIRYSL